MKKNQIRFNIICNDILLERNPNNDESFKKVDDDLF